ncbi:MAG TPA: hypothetical protein VFG66_04195, partial [Gemmatimonadales bacterium]|nr:hypothetical protein [Gemmatimonadales bacterium]
MLAAARDREPYVALTAIDSLGGGCSGRNAAAAALRRIADASLTSGPPDHRWQPAAHAPAGARAARHRRRRRPAAAIRGG